MITPSFLRMSLLRIAFVAGSLAASASAVEVAGSLLIDLDAVDYRAADGIWPQHSLTGIQGSFAKLPAGTPKLQTIGGKVSLVLDGDDDYLTGPLTTSALYAAGANHSVEYWVFQGQARPEETVISWSGRGAPNGSGAAFRYSSAAGSGAVGRWGGPDMGFAAPLLGGPELGKWHHIVLTYDGTTQRLYVDGALNTSEASALDALDSKPMYIGTERLPDGTDSGRTRQFSGAISRIRVHSGVLTGDQILSNYTAEAPLHPGITSVPLSHPPIHRWSFNEAVGAAPEGTLVKDGIGGLTAMIRGQGATLTGSQISLPGGLPATLPAYVDLPNGLISGRQHLTLEFWATQTSTQAGSRMVSFGRSNAGEINAAGNATAFSGVDYLSLYANVNTTTSMRL
ncbi:MAG: hypothetical protein JWO82_3736, partial [Akkermansiaceae bacterium]|nr:hypothetical protein [Akkermansiaceae bacterium]